MKLVVHDASILIDLALSGTVDAWFSIGIETWTTGLIYTQEITGSGQQALFEPYVTAKRLLVKNYSAGAEMDMLVAYQRQVSRGLSLADISVFALTKQLGPTAVLATGDKSLRKLAEREKLSACGVLKLFDHMVDGFAGKAGVLLPAVAISRLKQLMAHPECRLPADKCEERLKKWGKRR